jgi:bifunctional non-homologous end joining protein LigD
MKLQLPATPSAEVEVDGCCVALTSLDRVVWPEPRITKRDMLAYYAAVAPVLLPHLHGRPLTMARFPDGVHARGFLQNECRGAPAWMHTATLELRTGALRRYCLVDNAASLLWVVNQGTVELHPYPATAERPDRPLAVLLDLDPGRGTTLLDAGVVALRLRDRLAADGLHPVVKTSGASGIHVAAPVDDATFAAVRAYARELAAALADEQPQLVADAVAHARRPGRVMIDWRQNDPRRSTAAPYSLRATTRPGVSVPLAWDELETVVHEADHAAVRFTPEAVVMRVARRGDLFASPAGRLAGHDER